MCLGVDAAELMGSSLDSFAAAELTRSVLLGRSFEAMEREGDLIDGKGRTSRSLVLPPVPPRPGMSPALREEAGSASSLVIIEASGASHADALHAGTAGHAMARNSSLNRVIGTG